MGLHSFYFNCVRGGRQLLLYPMVQRGQEFCVTQKSFKKYSKQHCTVIDFIAFNVPKYSAEKSRLCHVWFGYPWLDIIGYISLDISLAGYHWLDILGWISLLYCPLLKIHGLISLVGYPWLDIPCWITLV